MDEKVIIESMVSGQVVLYSPETRFSKTWPKKGTKIPISKDFLREAIYDPGVEYMFKHGMLAMNDMDFKIELGLEEPETKEPTNIIPVDQKYMDRVLKLMPKPDMRKAITKMSREQRQEFVDYAASQKDINLDRIAIIDEICKTNMLKLIEVKKIKEE